MTERSGTEMQTGRAQDSEAFETKDRYLKYSVSLQNLCRFITGSLDYEQEINNIYSLWHRAKELYCAHVEQMQAPNFDIPKVAAHKQWELSGLYGYGEGTHLSEIDVPSLAMSIKTGKICHVTDDEHAIDLLSRYVESVRIKHVNSPVRVDETPRSLTVSQTVAHSEHLAAKGQMERQEVMYLQLDLWPQLETHYMAYREEQYKPVKNIRVHEMALRWQASKLEPVDSTISRLGAITVDSLVESVSSGAIRAITRDREYQVDSLVRFLKPYTGRDIEPGDYDESPLRERLDELKHHHTVMREMIAESHEREYKGKFISGPYRNLFARVGNEYMKRLHQLDARLTGDAFHADSYRSVETVQLIRQLDIGGRIGRLSDERLDALGKVSDLTAERDRTQTIPPGLFDRPRPAGQHNSQACATAAFRMIYQELTGHFLGEEEIREYINQTYGFEFISDVEYLKFLETETFEEEYDRVVGNVLYGSMSLAALRKYVERRREQQPETDVFVVAALRTRAALSTSPSRAQHRVVMLGAEQEAVQVIDPLKPFELDIPKRSFLRRWASAQNSGYIVVAE